MPETTPKPTEVKAFTVALTGGIASGKTAVSDYFAAQGVHIVDTDVIARQVVEPGQPGLQAIVDLFGEEILDRQGQLDRRQMRRLISDDHSQKDKLESILHPLIRQQALDDLAACPAKTYAMVVVPLLVETGMFLWADRVLVVDVSRATQLQRLMRRDNMTLEFAEQMLATQVTQDQRLTVADDVISNEDTLEALYAKCLELHHHYQQLANYCQLDS